MKQYELRRGDCLSVMREIAASSVDAIVTDPPYGLGFMGKEWDHSVPGEAYWREALRVAKPGAHLLCFGGTRTYHRMACAIEDAGWEIRDCIMWVYGSGFPKSMDVAKAIDKQRNDDPRPVCRYLRDAIERSDETTATIAEKFGFNRRMVEHWAARDTDSQPTVPTIEQWSQLKDILGLASSMDPEVERLNWRKGEFGDDYKNAEIVGAHQGDAPGLAGERFTHKDKLIRAPHSDQAKQWDGWGTCLKPAWEPIIVARKPLDGTVASNVMEHGTGAINIDACRVPTGDNVSTHSASKLSQDSQLVYGTHGKKETHQSSGQKLGRFPANLVHDGSDEVVALFPDSKGQAGAVRGDEPSRVGQNGIYGTFSKPSNACEPRGDSGSAARFFNTLRDGEASAGRTYTDRGGTNFAAKPGMRREPTSADRFFYCAKASRKDRGEGNDHPTVKPTALMSWLVRLVTRKGGTVLDPFCGSGSTGMACAVEGDSFIGIEMNEHYADIAEKRLAAAYATA